MNSLIMGYCFNPGKCLYGTFLFPCAIASAKSRFDGSGWCFNLVCFGCSPCIVRNYIRLGYEIDGRIGYSDCFCPTFCAPCTATQLLNEVDSRGPKIISARSGPWLAEKSEYSAIGDPCDFCCTFTTCNCETANVFSQLTGSPFWFALCSNFCQTQHLIRKSYGIAGEDCQTDCVRPCCCMIIPFVNCVYFYKEIASLRAEMMTRGRAYNYTLDRPPLPSTNYKSVTGANGNELYVPVSTKR